MILVIDQIRFIGLSYHIFGPDFTFLEGLHILY